MKEASSITLFSVVAFFLYVLGLPLLLFLVAGDWSWGLGWVFYGTHVFFSLGARVLIAYRNPALLAERAQSVRQENMADYDRLLAPFVGLLGPLLSYILMGLDHRLGEGRCGGCPDEGGAVENGRGFSGEGGVPRGWGGGDGKGALQR